MGNNLGWSRKKSLKLIKNSRKKPPSCSHTHRKFTWSRCKQLWCTQQQCSFCKTASNSSLDQVFAKITWQKSLIKTSWPNFIIHLINSTNGFPPVNLLPEN
jgi:hypothetical protein